MAGAPITSIFGGLFTKTLQSLARTEGPLVREVKNMRGYCIFTLNPCGAAALLYVVISLRASTMRQLSLLYTKDELDGYEGAKPPPYNAVEACSFVAGENPSAPTLVSILGRISCASKPFDQYANWLAIENPRPGTFEEEAMGSSFIRDESGSVHAVYRVMPGDH